jgi:di/tricarboxylate transporter
MTSQTWLVFGVLGATIILFVMDRLRSDVVALMAVLALILTGLLTAEQALAGFAHLLTLTIASLFVVGGGLFRTGVADLIGRGLLRASGRSETRLLIVVLIGAALLAGFLSNTGTTAVLLPAIVSLAWSIGSRPSRLLIPLAFASQIEGVEASAGSILAA